MKDVSLVSASTTMPNLLISSQQQTNFFQPSLQMISAVTNSPLLYAPPFPGVPLLAYGQQPVQRLSPESFQILPAEVTNISNFSLADSSYFSQPCTSSAQPATTKMPSASAKRIDKSKSLQIKKIFTEIQKDAMIFIKQYANDKTYARMPKGTIIAGLAFNQGFSIEDESVQKKIRVWAFCTKLELKMGVDYILNESESASGRKFLSKLATISSQSRQGDIEHLTKKIDGLSLSSTRGKIIVSGKLKQSEKSINRFKAVNSDKEHLPLTQYELRLETSKQNFQLTSNILKEMNKLNKDERDALSCAMKAMANQDSKRKIKISDVIRIRLLELRLIESRFRMPVLTPAGEEVLSVLSAAEQSVTATDTASGLIKFDREIITSTGQLTRSELAFLLANKVEVDNVLQLANIELITKLIVQTPFFRNLSAYLVIANKQHEVVKVITYGASLTPEAALTSALPAAVIQQVNGSHYQAYGTHGDNVSVEMLADGGLRVSSEQLLTSSRISAVSLVDAAAMAIMGIAAETEMGMGANPERYCKLLREQVSELISLPGGTEALSGSAEFSGLA